MNKNIKTLVYKSYTITVIRCISKYDEFNSKLEMWISKRNKHFYYSISREDGSILEIHPNEVIPSFNSIGDAISDAKKGIDKLNS